MRIVTADDLLELFDDQEDEMAEAQKDRAKMLPKHKKWMNNEIHRLLKPIYFRQIPLADLFAILEKYGYAPLQEDDTYWSGLLLGGLSKTEQVYFRLGLKSTKDERGVYQEIDNAMLSLSYYRLKPGGSYGVVAYIS